MPDFKTLKELVRDGLVPSKGSRACGKNKDLYNVEKTEELAKRPFSHPIKNAKIYIPKGSKIEYFRKSECEPTYSKTRLKKEFGIKSVEGVEPVSSYYSSKLRDHCYLYALSQFKNAIPKTDKEIKYQQSYDQLKNSIQSRHNTLKIRNFSEINAEIPSLTYIRFELPKLKINGTLPVNLSKLAKQQFEELGLIDHELLFKDTLSKISEIYQNHCQHINDEIQYIQDISPLNLTLVTSADFDLFSQKVIDRATKLQETFKRREFFLRLVNEKPYEKTFPASNKKRRITIYCGQTNSGKTYRALEVIKNTLSDSQLSGCFFPLRLLASQAFNDINESGVKANLITGEERCLSPDARIDTCTVETLDPTKEYNSIFIDEAQLLFDHGREPAYVRAIMGALCENLYLSVSPTYLKSLIKFLKDLGESDIEVIQCERLCPLEISPTIRLTDIQHGDVVVAYTVSNVHSLANKIARRGLKVGLLYGKMSPSSRNKMMSEFMDRSLDVLVATDAIGMGLSIPAKRIVFSEGIKFDGRTTRALQDEEIRQVAGRAGRFGYYDIGYVTTLSPKDTINTALPHEKISNALVSTKEHISNKKFNVIPDKHIILAAENLSLMESLNSWDYAIRKQESVSSSYSHLSEFRAKAKFLDKRIGFSRQELVELLYVTYPSDRFDKYEGFYTLCVEKIESNESIEIADANIFRNGNHINSLEDTSMCLNIMAQLQRIFPSLLPIEEEIYDYQTSNGIKLTEALLEHYSSLKDSTNKKQKRKRGKS